MDAGARPWARGGLGCSGRANCSRLNSLRDAEAYMSVHVLELWGKGLWPDALSQIQESVVLAKGSRDDIGKLFGEATLEKNCSNLTGMSYSKIRQLGSVVVLWNLLFENSWHSSSAGYCSEIYQCQYYQKLIILRSSLQFVVEPCCLTGVFDCSMKSFSKTVFKSLISLNEHDILREY